VTGKRVDQGLLGMAAGAAADPLIAQLVTPQALIDLLRVGWPKGVIADAPAGISAPRLDALGNVFGLYAASEYGLGEFRLGLPLDTPPSQRLRVRLALSHWTWQLSGLDLPPELTDQLLREALKGRQSG
jgi:hypothetical protein